MEATTWYTGEEAVTNGFCDELMFGEVNANVENGEKIIVNSVSMDMTKLVNIPTQLLNTSCFSNTPQNKTNLGNTQNKEAEPMPELNSGNTKITTEDELKAAYPELIKNITDGATATERKRIQDIEGVTIAGFETIVQDAKFTNPVAAAALSMSIIAKMKEQGATYIDNRDADVKASGMEHVGNENQETVAKTKENPYDAAIDKFYPLTT